MKTIRMSVKRNRGDVEDRFNHTHLEVSVTFDGDEIAAEDAYEALRLWIEEQIGDCPRRRYTKKLRELQAALLGEAEVTL